MTNIKNDRPQGAPRTTSTTGPAPAPPPEQSSVDDLNGVTDLEALEGMSLDNGTSFETSAASTKTRSTTVSTPTKSLEAPAKSAAATDVDAVTKLADREIGSMKPGEKVAVGAKFEGSVEIAVGVEVGIEIERRADGKYEVKLEQAGFIGVGGALGAKGIKGEVKGGISGAVGVSFVVDTPLEAAKIVAEATAGAAAGQLILPGSATIAAAATATALNHDKVHEVHLEIGLEVELELDVADQLKAVAGAGISAGIVYAAPGEAFLELKAKGELGGELDVQGFNVGSGGGEGEITVRVPLGKVASADALADPAVQKMLLAKAGKEPPGTTMSYERTTAFNTLSGVEVHVEKKIEGNRLDKLFAAGGWEVRSSINVGPKIGGPIGTFTAEIVAQRSVTLFETTASTPEDAAKQLNAHAAEIAADAKKAKQP